MIFPIFVSKISKHTGHSTETRIRIQVMDREEIQLSDFICYNVKVC